MLTDKLRLESFYIRILKEFHSLYKFIQLKLSIINKLTNYFNVFGWDGCTRKNLIPWLHPQITTSQTLPPNDVTIIRTR